MDKFGKIRQHHDDDDEGNIYKNKKERPVK